MLDTPSGLTQGFERVFTGRFGELEGERLLLSLDDALLETDPTRPLLLVLNIADAHAPWEAVPSGLDWVEPTPAFSGDTERWFAASAREREAQLPDRRAVYRWGMYRADRTLGAALRMLEEQGWLGARDCLVVTTDHGEVFGEGGLIGHGGSLLPANVGGLLVTRGCGVSELPEPLSGAEAFSLLVNGSLSGAPVEAVSFPYPPFVQQTQGRYGNDTWLTAWNREGQWIWRDGELRHREDQADPWRQTDDPGPLAPLIAQLQAYEAQDQALDPELEGMLRAAGYMGD